MKLGSSAEIIMEALIPSWGELNVSLAIAIFCIICFGLLRHMEKLFGRDPASRPFPVSGHEGGILDGSSNKTNSAGLDLQSSYIYLVKLELLAAKDLIAANISGTSDPYAIIECGSEKRFSSMVPGTRNPIWGEDFELFIEELPSEVHVSIYDWDIITKSSNLGSVTLKIEKECQTEAMWYSLGGRAGQVCIKMMTKRCVSNASGITDGLAGIIARKRLQDKPAGTEVLQKPGPLQTIFDLPPDEGVEHKFSCALERSFLYHGRMYVSSWHICFHSNVFSKQLKVVLPYEYIEEIKKSQHALINPAITIILRAGSGGIGVPPLASSDGRAKYMFASFWNRNHALRVLQRAANNFQKLEEEAKQPPLLRVRSIVNTSTDTPLDVPLVSTADDSERPEDTKIVQPFLKEEVLVEILQGIELPCTAEQFFSKVLGDDSKFIEKYRAAREDKELKLEPWHAADQYSGLVRTVTFRSLCHNPMCPSETAMTDLQHVLFRNDRKLLVLETIQQAHDVPFGSAFQVEARWMFEKISEAMCTVSVQVGTHFKKRLFMGSKIRHGAEAEYKADAMLFIDSVRKGLEEDKIEVTQEDAGLSSVLQEDYCIPKQVP